MNAYYQQFKNDLKKAHYAESIVKLVLSDIFDGKKNKVEFKDVSDDKRFYHKGDIEVTDAKGRHSYIDVKDDGVWHKSGNLNAEHKTKKGKNPWKDGFMLVSDYDLVAYHSKKTQKILLVDFKAWKKVYMRGSYGWRYNKHFGNGEQTIIYLNPIDKLKEEGIVLFEIDYDFSGSYENPESVWCTHVEKFGKYKDEEMRKAS